MGEIVYFENINLEVMVIKMVDRKYLIIESIAMP